MPSRIDRRSVADFLEDVDTLLRSDGPPAYALLVGSGFSYPLIPTGSGMIRDIPWWLYWQRRRNERGSGLPSRFTHRLAPGDPAEADLVKFECTLWQSLVDRQPGLLRLKADGTPDLQQPNAVAAAYTSLMSSTDPRGLNTPNKRRAYLLDVIRRVGREINQAHLYLAGILQIQDAADSELAALWDGRRPFCRTIFTTNFDPLLQRSLQLVGKLYSLSDRPDVLEPPDDNDSDAIQLIYTHGSSHRYLLLNTQEEIERARRRNAAALSRYFERHGVIVIGYSGWQDTTMTALQQCAQFDGNLYWVDIHDATRIEETLAPHVVEFLEQHRGNAFYVQSSADDLLAALHGAMGLGPAPRCLVDPIGLVMDQLRRVQLSERPFVNVAARNTDEMDRANVVNVVGADRLHTASSQSEFLRITLTRLESAKQFFDQPQLFARGTAAGEPAAGASDDVVRSALSAKMMSELTQAALAGNLTRAEALADQLLDTSDDPAARAMAFLSRGFVRIDQRRFEEAVADFSEGLKVESVPVQPRTLAYLHRGVALDVLGRFDEALDQYEQVLRMADAPESSRAMALVSRGARRMHSGDTGGAIADFTQAAELPGALGATRARARYNRGVAYYGLEQHAEALADFDAAVDMDEIESDIRALALNNRGILRLQAGNLEAAREDFERALNLQGATPEARYLAMNNRGRLLMQAQDYQPALVDFEAIVTAQDASPRAQMLARTNMALLYAELGRYDDAVAQATAVIQAQGVDNDAYTGSLLNRGRALNGRGDSAAAVADFNAILAMPNAGRDHRIKAHLNRAFAYTAMGDRDAAVQDLKTVIEEGAPVDLVAMARHKRSELMAQAQRYAEAIDDLTAILNLQGSKTLSGVHIQVVRASLYLESGQFAAALADCDAVAADPAETPLYRAAALFQKGLVHERMGDLEAALADYQAVIEVSGFVANRRGLAHLRRGLIYDNQDREALAIPEYTAAIETPDIGADSRALAHLRRGIARRRLDDLTGSLADLTTVLEMPEKAPQPFLDAARFHRAMIHVQRAQYQEAIDEFSIVVDGPGTLGPTLAETLLWRGRCFATLGNAQQAIADYSAAIETPGVSPAIRAEALIWRAVNWGNMKEYPREHADLSSIIDMPDAPESQRARARIDRGCNSLRGGHYAAAREDFEAALGMPGGSGYAAEAHFYIGIAYQDEGNPAAALAHYSETIQAANVKSDLRAKALNNRAIVHLAGGAVDAAMADWAAVLALPDPHTDQKVMALRGRAEAYGRQSDWRHAMEDCTRILEMPEVPAADRVVALVVRGWYAYEAGDAAAMIEDTIAALEIDPRQENALFNLALGYLVTGRPKRARVQYERACRKAGTRDVIEASLGDIEAAVSRFGPLEGSDDAMAMIRNRLDKPGSAPQSRHSTNSG